MKAASLVTFDEALNDLADANNEDIQCEAFAQAAWRNNNAARKWREDAARARKLARYATTVIDLHEGSHLALIRDLVDEMRRWGAEGDGVPEDCKAFDRAVRLLSAKATEVRDG